ncbi:hypothetical protein C5167_022592 [Papaver somniferum]|uniref:Uncharacterized protein n=1 Tax=Papaver somniferum TaxID=3469 RepID=A0A4Y7JJ83_PAPSO|nr:hypothetical protein C5167_022592 [Papaver somniferum]
MLSLTYKALEPGFPSTSSLVFVVIVNVFFRTDLIGSQPTAWALSREEVSANSSRTNVDDVGFRH